MKLFKATIKWIAAIALICVAAVFLMSINGLSVSRTIATVGDMEVTEAEYKYYLELIKSQMVQEAGGTADKDFWDAEVDGKKRADTAKERAMEEMMRTQVAVIKANEAGITLTPEQESGANAIVNANSAAEKEQLKELEKNTGADKFQLAEFTKKSLLANSLYQTLATQENSPIAADSAAVDAAANEEYAVVKHVLVMNAAQNTEENAQPEDPEKYMEEAKKKAEDVLAKAVKGDNFEKLIAEYGEDPGMESTPDGYVIDKNGTTIDGSGTMVEEFTKGSFAVKPGEVNPQLVESSYGWHIIKRYPLPTSGETLTQIQSAASNTVMYENYNKFLDSEKEKLNITVADKIYGKIKVK